MEEVQNTHGQIIDKIQVIQYRTSKVMVDQEKDIMRFFINKINEIKKEFEEEKIKKGKNDQDYLQKENQLISELEWIKNIAQKIDKENHDLMKQFMELKAKYYTQESDREMLLKQLIIKKKKNAVLKNQLKHYEKLLEQVEQPQDNYNGWGSGQPKKSSPQLQPLNVSVRNTTTDIEKKTVIERYGRYEDTIKSLQSQLRKEQKKTRSIKEQFMKSVGEKQEIEEIIKECIEDLKMDVIKVKSETRTTFNGKGSAGFTQQKRQQLVQKLLNNEKILSLIYDKTFYDHNAHLDFTPIQD